MSKIGTPSEKEGLRLMLAYLQISDPEQRKRLLQLAEIYANLSAETFAGDVLQDNQKPNETVAADDAEDHRDSTPPKPERPL